MIADLHNHTPLCNHAKGSIDDYIQAAIASDTKYFGFSDHAPMSFDTTYRMRFEDMPIYEQQIAEAHDRYQSEITVLSGYEVDFMPQYLDERVLNAPVDYLIGSVHFLGEWGFDNPDYIQEYQNRDIDTIYRNYFEQIKIMAQSGHFQIVGHLDLIKVMDFHPKQDVRILAGDAIKAIKKADMVIEISSAGLRKPIKEIYPSAALMELIAETKIPITFASDAHHPKQVGFAGDKLRHLAQQYGYSQCAIFHKKEREMIKF